MPIMKGRGIHWHPQTAELLGTTTRVDAVLLPSWLGRALLRSRRAWGMLSALFGGGQWRMQMSKNIEPKSGPCGARVPMCRCPCACAPAFRFVSSERKKYTYLGTYTCITYIHVLRACKVCVPAVSFRRSNVPRCVPVAKLQQAYLVGWEFRSVRCEEAVTVICVPLTKTAQHSRRSLTLNYYVGPQITARPSSLIYAPQRLAYFCLSDPSGVSVPHHINPIIRVCTSQQQ